jgi:mannose-6-phosphate isomerase-like protein (cupin superfamily)
MSMALRFIRRTDLEPFWGVLRAREPGFQRSLITWMGGPEGYINTNPGIAVESRHCAVGLMDMGVGNRQPGVHTHTVTEIYVILDGQCESFDGVGNTHIAGPLDCLYIPKGVPHGVRTLGDRPLKLLWVNDDIERWGVSVYAEGPGPHPADDEVHLIAFADLERSLGSKAGRGGWDVTWVGGSPARANPDPGLAASNERVSLGLTALGEGGQVEEPASAANRIYICIAGRARVADVGGAVELGPEDAVFCPAGAPLRVEAIGSGSLMLVRVEEAA